MQPSNSRETNVAAEPSRRGAFERIFMTPLERFLPRWARITIVILIVLFYATTWGVLTQRDHKFRHHLRISLYKEAVEYLLKQTPAFNNLTIQKTPDPQWWSNEYAYIEVGGEVPKSEDYAQLLVCLSDPGQSFVNGQLHDMMREIDQKIAVDVTIRDTGEPKRVTLLIPQAKSADEDED